MSKAQTNYVMWIWITFMLINKNNYLISPWTLWLSPLLPYPLPLHPLFYHCTGFLIQTCQLVKKDWFHTNTVLVYMEAVLFWAFLGWHVYFTLVNILYVIFRDMQYLLSYELTLCLHPRCLDAERGFICELKSLSKRRCAKTVGALIKFSRVFVLQSYTWYVKSLEFILFVVKD